MALVLSGTALPASPGTAAPTQPAATTCPATAPDRATAAAIAARCRRQVEDESARTEKAQVFVNADATLTAVTAARVQRVRKDGGWATPDPALRPVDGRLAPVASATDMSFSAGGDAPLVTLRAAKGELSLRWPGPLPPPTVSGAQVTYPSVLPDVDLVVTADVEGFSEVLVVKTPAAAKNPALAEVRFAVEAKGLTMRAGDAGTLKVVDGAGATVFASGTPKMWDSSGQGSDSDSGSDARGATAGARDAAMPLTLSGSTLTVRPDRKFLTASATTYPVFVDPALVASAWTMINSRFTGQSYWSYDKFDCPKWEPKTKSCAKVGYTDEAQTMTYRSLFEFQNAEYLGKHVLDAKLTMELLHSWSCGGTNTDVHRVGNAPRSDTNWGNNAGSWVYPAAASGSSFNCSKQPKHTEWGLTGLARQAAAEGWGSITLGLKAMNESNHNAWKKFDASTARFVVTYNSYPNAPDQLRVADGTCGTGAGRPYVRTLTPQLRARVSDADGLARPLNVTFTWWQLGGTVGVGEQASQADLASGTDAVVSIPAGKLVDGRTYVVRAQAGDGIDVGQFSAQCEFTVDVTPPSTPGAVGSTSYPSDGQLHGGAGIAGTFTIAPPAMNPADVVAYAYTVDGGIQGAQAPRVNAGTDHGATVSVTPPTDGVHTLRVWAIDVAGNLSAAPSTHTFGVRAGSGPDALWRFEESSGAAVDSTGHGNAMTLTGVGRTSGRGGTVAVPNGGGTFGTTAGPIATRDPVTGGATTVRTDANFAVSFWAQRPAAIANSVPVVVSADGERTSAFWVGYHGTDQRWTFAMASVDGDAPSIATVKSDAAPAAGMWTHVAAVYDAASHTLRMYVDGVAQAQTATLTGGFNATGPLVLGGRKSAGARLGGMVGVVDDLRVYARTLSPTEMEFEKQLKPVSPIVTLSDGGRVTIGRPLQVTLDARGDTTITRIRYSLGDQTLSGSVTLPAAGGKATVTVTPTVPGSTFVFAASVTANNRQSETAAAVARVTDLPAVNGTASDANGNPAVNALVRLEPGGATLRTGPDGSFAFPNLAAGQYIVTATGGPCGATATSAVTIDEPTFVGLTLFPQADLFGYTCSTEERPFVPADQTVLPLTGDDKTIQVTLPFTVPFYGESATTAWVSTNGTLSIGDGTDADEYRGTSLPDRSTPNGVIAPFWDDLMVDGSASVRTAVLGTAPNRQFVVEWRNVIFFSEDLRVTFEVILSENGDLAFTYANLGPDPTSRGAYAAVGVESRTGGIGTQYSFHEPLLADGSAVVITRPTVPRPIGPWTVSGRVTRNGAAVPNALVSIDPLWTDVQTTTGSFALGGVESGRYVMTARQGCDAGAAAIDVAGDTQVDIPLNSMYRDPVGYGCTVATTPFVPADQTILPWRMAEEDLWEAYGEVPFPFQVFDFAFTTFYVTEEGDFYLEEWWGSHIRTLNAYKDPHTFFDAQTTVRTALIGTAPNRQFVVEVRNLGSTRTPTSRVSYEVIFGEDGLLTYNYAGIDEAHEREARAVRVSDFWYSRALPGQPEFTNNRAVTFHRFEP
ncbi:LamG-like jellyroll fold domain-containing protein [Virgisporangium aurantiacum]|uniref:LamG-like jellyroll fold domain-containing protein n=1 Tax=Virgisporangium aurantiacum TaxID=175570 RepID=A0A8J3ZK62_9ACTN|nr:LamG-like jellyroll fold domain-containing protein [Virgisporangium aurantiacum]GIJ62978.1 hypothetical protein Vau01_104940 [Virgisporangium aurantiacum]